MQITVTIPDEWASMAQAHGESLEEYVEGLLLAQTHPQTATDAKRQEMVHAMLRFAEQHRATLGGDELKALIHDGHRY